MKMKRRDDVAFKRAAACPCEVHGGARKAAGVSPEIKSANLKRLKRIEGQVLRENTTMLSMCHELGFQVKEDPCDATVMLVSLVLFS